LLIVALLALVFYAAANRRDRISPALESSRVEPDMAGTGVHSNMTSRAEAKRVNGRRI
jgi:hypothetical protein